jgi:hypothetical protein
MTKMHSLIIILATVGFVISGCSATGATGGQTEALAGSSDGSEADNAAAAGSTVGPSLSGFGGAAGGTGEGNGVVAGFGPDECAKTEVNITRNPINVILVVDRSTTMVMSRFGNYNTRWDALQAALMGDPDGLVPQYEQIVRFGYEGFTGFPEDPNLNYQCPDLASVPYEINNYDTILPVYEASRPADLLMGAIGQTPTGESLKIIIDNLENQFATLDVLGGGPFIIILATDGEPDTCLDPNNDGSPAATQLVVDQIARAYGLGIRTYVLSVGAETSDAHLQAVANAGTGTTNAPFWKADNDQGLEDALAAIIGEALSCTLELEGEIIDTVKACEEGTVVINGEQIYCSNSGSNSENGWRVVDKKHIELLGQACTTLKSSPSVTLEASFPCGIYVL